MSKPTNNKTVDATLNDDASNKSHGKTNSTEHGGKDNSKSNKPFRGKGRRDRNNGKSATNTFPGNDIA